MILDAILALQFSIKASILVPLLQPLYVHGWVKLTVGAMVLVLLAWVCLLVWLHLCGVRSIFMAMQKQQNPKN